jgi:FkbM family methyltransferase
MASMFTAATKALKTRAPNLHRWMKGAFRWSKLPAIKLLNGKLALASPALFGASPTEPHVLRWIDEQLRSGDTFLDVGAHYGWMSLVACRRVGASGKVFAFEPSPPLVEFLQYNKRANRCRQMEIVRKAVTDSDGSLVSFYLVGEGNSFLNSLVDHPIEPTVIPVRQKQPIQVETITLDEFCKTMNLRPKAVKIDVEGAELLVLRGCRTLLKECRATFIVAVHPTWLPQGQSASELFELFRVNGYKVAASEVVPFEGADCGDYLFVPS